MVTNKKVMISQPMAGKTPEEILKVRDKAVKYLEGLGYEVLDTYFPNDFKQVTPEERESIEKMVERLEEFDDVQTVYTNMKPEE